MNRIVFGFLGLFAILACGCPNTEEFDRQNVQKQQSQYAKVQPVPQFDYSLEREAAIQLYKMRNERVRTWSVWRSDYGMIEGHCESIGFPIPYDVQLTNPLQTINGPAVIEQAEPNGLFSSKNTTATWVRSVVKHNGKVMEVPIYIEGKVTCYPYPIIVDYDKNRVTRADGEEPTVQMKAEKK